jgi:hypothetical protein
MPLKSSNRRQHGAASVAKAATPAPVKVAVKVAGTGKSADTAPAKVISSHSHTGVFLWSTLLLVFATYKGFWQPTINTIWTGAKWSTPIDGRLILGGIVFAIVLAMIADSSDDAASVIIIMLVGMWLLFLMFNGLTTIEAFFNWFGTSGLGSVTGGGTSDTSSSGSGSGSGNQQQQNPGGVPQNTLNTTGGSNSGFGTGVINPPFQHKAF